MVLTVWVFRCVGTCVRDLPVRTAHRTKRYNFSLGKCEKSSLMQELFGKIVFPVLLLQSVLVSVSVYRKRLARKDLTRQGSSFEILLAVIFPSYIHKHNSETRHLLFFCSGLFWVCAYFCVYIANFGIEKKIFFTGKYWMKSKFSEWKNSWVKICYDDGKIKGVRFSVVICKC